MNRDEVNELMMRMFKRGYSEGGEDYKKSVVQALDIMIQTMGDRPVMISEIIEGVKRIEIDN